MRWVLIAGWAAGCHGTTPGPTDTSTDSPETDTTPDDTGTPEDTAGTLTDAEVTWQRDVRPLMDVHCAGCHVDGGTAPFTFDDPADLPVLGPSIVQAVTSRSMPPYSFLPGCREIEGDLRLADATIETFRAWGEGGYAIGREADYVAPELPQRLEPPPHDLQAFPNQPFSPNLSQPDDYVCRVSDVTFAEETFVSWAEIDVDREELVHHVIVYAVPPERLDDLEELAGGDLNAQFPCWESPVVYLGPTVSAWAPGPQPDYVPTTDALRVPAGSKIVIEVHYNTLQANQVEVATDNSSIRLWTTPEEEVENLLVLWTAYDYELDIPAGDPDVVEQSNVRLPVEAPLVMSSPHMHLLGTGVHSEVRRVSGDTACVSDVAWDFAWQRGYTFPAEDEIPYSASAGDSIDLTCRFDNSPEHQPIVDGVRQEPRDVAWGDGSLDEMCIDFMTFRVPFDPTASRGMCGGFDKCYQQCAPNDPTCPLVCMGQSGEACFTCGVEGMYGGCTTRKCPVSSLRFTTCLARCEDLESDFFGCMVEECGPELAELQSCAQPLFADGTCAEDYADCSGLVP